MTSILPPLLNGISLAALFVLLVRTVGRRHAIPLHTAMLLVAPLLYVLFAARAGAWNGLPIELTGTATFGGMAFFGLRRRSAGILALGWALHPVWDVAFHTVTEGAAYTPEGYVVACIGFDLLLAALIATGSAGIPAGSSHDRRRRNRLDGDDGRDPRPVFPSRHPVGAA
jgi:hypothetical protein